MVIIHRHIMALCALPGFFGDEAGGFAGLGVGEWGPLPLAMIEAPEVNGKKWETTHRNNLTHSADAFETHSGSDRDFLL